MPKVQALLRPGGCLAICWNVYRHTGIGDPFAEAVIPLLEGIDLPPSEAANSHYSQDSGLRRASFTAAGFDQVEHHVFRRERTLSAAAERALYASF